MSELGDDETDVLHRDGSNQAIDKAFLLRPDEQALVFLSTAMVALSVGALVARA